MTWTRSSTRQNEVGRGVDVFALIYCRSLAMQLLKLGWAKGIVHSGDKIWSSAQSAGGTIESALECPAMTAAVVVIALSFLAAVDGTLAPNRRLKSLFYRRRPDSSPGRRSLRRRHRHQLRDLIASLISHQPTNLIALLCSYLSELTDSRVIRSLSCTVNLVLCIRPVRIVCRPFV
jgi:hypothetical protein